MRRVFAPVLLLALVLSVACAGPRLASEETTAHLPPPAVRRVTSPPAAAEVVVWPVLEPEEAAALCDT